MTTTVDRDQKLLARTKELLASDFEKAEPNSWLRYRKALAQAAKEIPAKVRTPIEDNQKPLSREERAVRTGKIQALTLTLLKTDPEMIELAKKDDYGAFKQATKIAVRKLRAFEEDGEKRELDRRRKLTSHHVDMDTLPFA